MNWPGASRLACTQQTHCSMHALIFSHTQIPSRLPGLCPSEERSRSSTRINGPTDPFQLFRNRYGRRKVNSAVSCWVFFQFCRGRTKIWTQGGATLIRDGHRLFLRHRRLHNLVFWEHSDADCQLLERPLRNIRRNDIQTRCLQGTYQLNDMIWNRWNISLFSQRQTCDV